MNKRASRVGCAGILLVVLLAVWWTIFPRYEPLPVSGPHPVATERVTFTDTTRSEPYTSRQENRRVNAAFWYPAGGLPGAAPLVIFSHGGLGTEDSNESLYRELASHGYVVCSIGHPYHALWTKGADGRITFVSRDYFGEIQRENARRDKKQSYEYYTKWMNIRTADMNTAIDTILERAGSGELGLYALINRTKIAVMGHSLGGSAALAVGRQRSDVDAVIALESPFLYDITGVKDDVFQFTTAAYPVPVLNIYSDSSWTHLAEWPQYAQNDAYLTDGPPHAYNLHLPGAGHFTLTDLALASPLLARLLEGEKPSVEPAAYIQRVNQASLAFLNRYLNDQPDAKEIER